jgi:hypothetical protein
MFYLTLRVLSLSPSMQHDVAHIYCGHETCYFTIWSLKKSLQFIIAQELESIKALQPLELAK